MKKHFFFLFLALAASVGILFAESGTCGKNLTWDLTDGVLTISGTGSMNDYAWNGSPWYSNKTIHTVIISNGVTSIANYAFYECKSLTSVTIPNSVTSIGDGAFTYCTALTSVTIPNSVTSIGNGAFLNCSGLTSVTIPSSVTSIGNSAFSGCYSLTSVTIPNSVTSIEAYAFREVPNIVYFGTADGSPWNAKSVNGYVDGYLIYSDASKTTLLACSAAAQGEIVIPNSVTSIGEYAFDGCYSLTSITIPNSVTNIGYMALYHVANIVYSGPAYSSSWDARSVNGYVDGYFVYSDASKTTLLACSATAQGEVVISSSVTSIGRWAFSDCSGITSVTIPNSVTSIANYAFSIFDNLTSIICYAVIPPECESTSFYVVDLSIPLYVPAGSVDAYKNAYAWKDFTNILPIAGMSTESAEVKATPSNSNSVSVTWPEVSGATTYTIEIKKNGVLICTLVFNAAGQLESLTFAAPARDGARNVASALQAGNGWTYTVTGLESNTEYTYTVIAKNANGGVLLDQTVGFKTPLPDGIEDVVSDSGAAVKTLYNGQVLIQRAGKTYTLQGQEVK